MSHKSGLQTATKTNINLRVKFWLRSPLATIYIYMLWIKTTFISQHVAFFFLIVFWSHFLLCSRIKLRRCASKFVEKRFQTVLFSAVQQRQGWCIQSAKRSSVVQCERDRNEGDVQVKVQKSLFRAQHEQTSTGKAVCSVDIGNVVNNSHL